MDQNTASTPRGGPLPKRTNYGRPFFLNDSNIEQTLVDTTNINRHFQQEPRHEASVEPMESALNGSLDECSFIEQIKFNKTSFAAGELLSALEDVKNLSGVSSGGSSPRQFSSQPPNTPCKIDLTTSFEKTVPPESVKKALAQMPADSNDRPIRFIVSPKKSDSEVPFKSCVDKIQKTSQRLEDVDVSVSFVLSPCQQSFRQSKMSHDVDLIRGPSQESAVLTPIVEDFSSFQNSNHFSVSSTLHENVVQQLNTPTRDQIKNAPTEDDVVQVTGEPSFARVESRMDAFLVADDTGKSPAQKVSTNDSLLCQNFRQPITSSNPVSPRVCKNALELASENVGHPLYQNSFIRSPHAQNSDKPTTPMRLKKEFSVAEPVDVAMNLSGQDVLTTSSLRQGFPQSDALCKSHLASEAPNLDNLRISEKSLQQDFGRLLSSHNLNSGAGVNVPSTVVQQEAPSKHNSFEMSAHQPNLQNSITIFDTSVMPGHRDAESSAVVNNEAERVKTDLNATLSTIVEISSLLREIIEAEVPAEPEKIENFSEKLSGLEFILAEYAVAVLNQQVSKVKIHDIADNIEDCARSLIDLINRAYKAKFEEINQKDRSDFEYALHVERQKAKNGMQERQMLCNRISELEMEEKEAKLRNAELEGELKRCMKSIDEADKLEAELLKYKIMYNELCTKFHLKK